MIAKLAGLLDSSGDGWAILDVSGVGYLLFCSGRTLARISAGQPARLWVETQMREDAIHLYGFIDTAERDWFRLLNTVQAVGGKAALAVLSVLSPEDLCLAIAAADKAAITRAPGVGPRLAERIISELKGRAASALQGAPASAPASVQGTQATGSIGLAADAVAALVNLGFRPSEALAAVSDASSRVEPAAGVEALIRASLSELAPSRHGGVSDPAPGRRSAAAPAAGERPEG